MKKKIILKLIALFLALINNALAQNNLSGTINHYAKITAIDTCAQSLTVSTNAGFSADLKVVIIQMKGASMSESNNASYGNITDLKNTGKYEINAIQSINGNTIFLKNKLLNLYDVAAALQLVSFPSYASATVQATLTAQAWDGNTGGVIAFEATTLNLNAHIDASNTGFTGGGGRGFNVDCVCQSPICSSPANDFFYNSTDSRGALKGEGISFLAANHEAGRGKNTTGGGGGNDHKSGGGGGGNGGAGGLGGINAEPDNFRCKGNFAGIGGAILAAANNHDRLFLGGGGGAGHSKGTPSVDNCRGGNGGGIILIKATTLNANNKSIKANGGDGLLGSFNAGGGGGAGGTIVLEANISGGLNIEAKGGKGGDSDNSNADRCQGGGGGGGGGKVLSKTTGTVANINISGGVAGQTINSSTSCGNIGSQAGGSGQNISLTNPNLLVTATQLINRTFNITQQPAASISSCPNRNVNIAIVSGGLGLNYQWEYAQATGGFQTMSDNNTYSGSRTANLTIQNVTTTFDQYRYRCVITSCTGQTLTSNISTLTLLELPNAAFDYNIVANTVTFTNQSTQALQYIWDFGDNSPINRQQNPTYTYSSQGIYDVTLKAINSCDTIVTTRRINLNSLPLASFRASTTDTCVQATIQFSNTSSNNTTQWYWEFPGGTPSVSNQPNPIIQYLVGGIYDVKLIVSNANGRDTLIRNQYIRVTGPPTTHFTFVRNSRIVTFTNNTGQGVSYNWDFGDGSAFSSQINPTHTYNRAGTFVVTLTARNPCGVNIFRDTIIMLALPTAQISANQSQGCVPMTVQFNAINALNVSNWFWQFPGGRPRTSNIANPVIQYDTVGTWPVLLTVSNSGETYELRDSFFIRVFSAPSPSFNVYKLSDNVIRLENLSIGAQNFSWNFGDNTTSNLRDPGTHRYNAPGVYSVTLLAYNQYCARGIAKQVALNFTPTEEFNQEGALQLAPNPTDGILILTFKTPKYLGQIVNFIDINGRIVKQLTLNQETIQTLDISDLAAGIYWVKIGTYEHIGKILKQ